MERVNESSNQNNADAVIVSAFGRGNWLAMELAARGWKVTLVDVSEKLGEWEAADAEGPFGFLQSANASDSDLADRQRKRLVDEGETLLSPQGLTFWLPDGPLEGKSELTNFQLGRRQVPAVVEDYLQLAGSMSREAESLRKRVSRLGFDENWLAGLAHQLGANIFLENHRASQYGNALPIFSSFWVRRATKAAAEKGLENCRAVGVNVRAPARVLDMRTNGVRQMEAVEVADEHAGIETGRTYVWMLSADETRYMRPALAEKLFPNEKLDPEWYWARYEVKLEGRVFDDQVPLHAVAIADLYLSWTHANLMVLRKRHEKNELDVWLKVPLWARFNREYLEKLGQEIERNLEARLPLSKPRLLQLPIEMRLPVEKLGPARFPIYEERSASKLRGYLNATNLKNVFVDGPEHWNSLDWTGAFAHQSMILTRLEKLKAIWDAEAKRLAQRAARQAESERRDLSP